jgi:hypothetical protein
VPARHVDIDLTYGLTNGLREDASLSYWPVQLEKATARKDSRLFLPVAHACC